MLSSLKLKDKLFYGWVVVAVFFVVFIALNGISLSFGVFFKSIGSEFNLTRAETSAVTSVNRVLSGICAFIAGWASDRYGPRIVILVMAIFTGLGLLFTSQANSLWQLFITYSLLLAVGTGAIFVVPTAIISRWFDKKRGLALGIAGIGQALGIVVVAPFATYLISNWDWRMAYLVIGVIAWLIVIPLSRLLRQDPYEIGALPDGVSSYSGSDNKEDSVQVVHSSLSQVFKGRNFWFMVFAWLPWALCLFLVYTHLVPHVTDTGMSAETAAGVLSLMGGSAVAGRLLMGIASDRVGRKLTVIICTLLQVGAMVWLIWAQDLWMFYLFAVVFGFAYSGLASSGGALVSDMFRLDNIGVIFGLLEISFGIGAAIGPILGGLIFDATSSYSIAYLIAGLGMLVSTIFLSLTR